MRRFLLTLLLSAAVAGPALAQSKKELAATDAALADRLSRLEQRFLTGDPAAVELMQRMDALESEQRGLTGEIEQLRFERDQLKAEIVAFNEDLKKIEELSDRLRLHLDAVDLVAKERAEQQALAQSRMANPQPIYPSQPMGGQTIYDGAPVSGSVISSQPSQVPGPPTSRTISVPFDGSLSESLNQPSSVSVQPSSPMLDDLPKDGLRKLNEGNFSGAQSDFQTYLAVAPDAADAGEVSFFLGETHFVKGSYADAADAYISAMKKDPQGKKAPDSLIRLSASLRELGNKGEACRALDSFTTQFPSAGPELRQKMRDERARTGC